MVFSLTVFGERTHYAYTTENGLLSNKVYRVLQDSKGLIWIATDAGVSTFDGNTFEHLTKEDGLLSLDILGMLEDKQGRIWFKSFQGDVSYYENGRVHNSVNEPVLKGIKTRSLHNSYKLSGNGVWINSDTFLSHFVEGNIEKYPLGHLVYNPHERNISGPYQQKEGALLFYNRVGIFSIEEDHLDYKHCWSAGAALDIQPIDSSLYFTREEGLYRYFDGKEELVISNLNVDLGAASIVPNSKGVWLVKSSGELYRVIKKVGVFSVELFQTGYSIGGVLEDIEGNIWVATAQNGLLFYPKYGIEKLFESTSSKILSCAFDTSSSCLYIGMEKGVLERRCPEGVSSFRVECPFRQTTNVITDIFLGEKIWFGSGCFAGSLSKDVIVPLHQTSQNPVGAIKSIAANDTAVYFASSSGVYSYNVKHTRPIDRVHQERAFDVMFGLNGELLIADKAGVIDYERSQKLFELPNSTLPRKMAYLGKDLVVATIDEGLYINTKDSTYHLTAPAHVLSNIGSDMAVENDSIFWYASRAGLNRVVFDRKNKSIVTTSIAKNQGLPVNDVKDIIIAGERLFIAAGNAVTSLDLNAAFSPSHIPIFFTSIRVGNNDLPFNKSIDLSYDHENLFLSFRAVHHISGDELGLRYRLKGLFDAWKVLDKSQLNFLTIPPGEYELQIEAKGIDGAISTTPLIIPITVSEAYWQTISFLVTFVFLVCLIGVGVSFYIVTNIKRREEAKTLMNSRLALSELRTLQAQMNPHFIYNALTSVQSFILGNEKDKASIYLARFAKLMRLTLDSSRSTTVNLQDEVKLLDNYLALEKQRTSDSFTYSITVDISLEEQEIMLPPLFIQPLLENAVKHGLSMVKTGHGKLSVSFENEAEELVVTVTDNGPGIENANTSNGTEHRSHATDIIYDRIKNFNQLYGYNIRLYYAPKGGIRGTKVYLYLPLIREHEDQGSYN